MPSLAAKLKSLGVEFPRQPIPADQKYPIERVVDGFFEPTANGSVFVKDRFIKADEIHGRIPLQPTIGLERILKWAKAPENCQSNIQDWVFLDTETTGLAGGVGAYAFLIGLGRFADDCFHLRQIFMRDPAEELALLTVLADFLGSAAALVTYNGKSFDGPLLDNRYVFNRVTSPIPPLLHIDLLHPARRIWKKRLANCTLGTIEWRILGVDRSEEDIDSALIPQLYFDYLRNHDARPLKNVFYHNALDILSLAALLHALTRLLNDPDQYAESPHDLVAVACWDEDWGNTSRACRLFEECLTAPLPTVTIGDVRQRLSFIYKRLGHYEEAVELWCLAAQAGELYAHEELAKYYEHLTANLPAARMWTENALYVLADGDTAAADRFRWQEAFEHRLQRLTQKMAAAVKKDA